MTLRKIGREALSFLQITLSCALYALAFCRFYQPSAISIGGFTGIAQILNHLFPILPIGVTNIVLNVPLFAIGVKKQGWRLLVSSLYSMTVGSLLIDLILKYHPFEPLDDLLLAGIFGGLLSGIAVGLELKAGATTGGTELAAKLLHMKWKHLSVGRLCLIVDLTVITLYALTFKQLTNALYGVVSMYVFSLAVDLVLYNGTQAKMAYVISEKNEEIRQKLLGMGLGITMVQSRGGYFGDEKQMLLCAFKRNQISAVKDAVAVIDPNAFLIVCDAHEVLGEGFGSLSSEL